MRFKSLVLLMAASMVVLAVVLLGLALLLHEDPGPADQAADAVTDSAPSRAASSSTPVATTSPTPTSEPPAIRTAKDFYFGRPYETIAISGRYVGVAQATGLRVQVHGPDGWQTFPLPAVTQESGHFRAFVELGAGQHRLRLVDPVTGTLSDELTLLLF